MRRLCALLLFALPGCGGGGGGGGGGGPPPPPFAVVRNSGLAIASEFPNAAALGPHILVAVSELQMGADLNGDADTNDLVVHHVEATTDAVTNLGFAVAGRILASDARFAFLVPEGAQGATDLDGDGDATDAMWFFFDPARPPGPANPSPAGVVSTAVPLPAAATQGGFVFVESEAAANLDRNGDGDRVDLLAVTFAEASLALQFRLVPVATARPLVARAGRVLFCASETAQPSDFNMDGDALDTVLVGVDFTTPAALLVPVGAGRPRAVANLPYALTGGEAVYLIDEASEAAFDFNGDGDATDAVFASFRFGVLAETIPQPAFACAAALGIGAGADRAVVGVDEAAQGNTNLNGDLDASDRLVGWVQTTAAPSALNLLPRAMATLTPRVEGPRALFAVQELADGITGTDHNGDGDKADNVLFVLDASFTPGTATSFALAVATLALSGDDALVGVSEAGQAGVDLNGDADANDVVLRYFDLSDPAPQGRSLGVAALSFAYYRFSPAHVRVAAILPEGQGPPFGDMNGDGDVADNHLVLLGVDPSQDPPAGVPRTPFLAGTASPSAAPPLRIADFGFAFPTSEAMAGEDLDGDGDQLDTVLRYVRYN
jgi:hypothetical protein